MLGKEFLSGLKENEVEIARVIMKSTTQDIISIRAKKRKKDIVYSVEDEYNSEEEGFGYKLIQKTSKNIWSRWLICWDYVSGVPSHNEIIQSKKHQSWYNSDFVEEGWEANHRQKRKQRRRISNVSKFG